MANKPNRFNAFVNLVFLGILFYLIFTNFFPASDSNTTQSAKGSQTQAAVQKTPSPFEDMSRVFGLIADPVKPVLNILQENHGSGSAIVCGQTITYTHTDKVLGEKTPFQTRVKATKKVGFDPIIEGHVQMLRDMKVGGAMTAQFSSKWGYINDGPEAVRGKDIETQLSFDAAVPAAPMPSMPIRLFPYPYNIKSPELIYCGGPVRMKLKIWTLEGKRLYPKADGIDEILSFTTGKGEVPLGIEQAVFGLSNGNKMTAIIPYEWLELFAPDSTLSKVRELFSSFAFPPRQAILVDIEILDAIEKATVSESSSSAVKSVPAEVEPPPIQLILKPAEQP